MATAVEERAQTLFAVLLLQPRKTVQTERVATGPGHCGPDLRVSVRASSGCPEHSSTRTASCSALAATETWGTEVKTLKNK